MMEDELRQFVKEQGWNLIIMKRGKKQYFYAQKWRRGSAYIGPVANLEKITKERVLEKLAKAL
jgi:hypothetical protein